MTSYCVQVKAKVHKTLANVDFGELDLNNHGKVDREEFRQAYLRLHRQASGAPAPPLRRTKLQPATKQTSREQKLQQTAQVNELEEAGLSLIHI